MCVVFLGVFVENEWMVTKELIERYIFKNCKLREKNIKIAVVMMSFG